MGSFLLQFVPTGTEKTLGTISSLIVMKRASRKSVIMPYFAKRDGLVPVVVSDKKSGRVLMLGYTDKTAFLATLQTGEAHFYSTSRKCLWKKGESSGNILSVHEIRIDCDKDALEYVVTCQASGNVCHTGNMTCFYRSMRPKSACS